MVFIPIITGEVWVHDIINGSYITHFQCPDYELEFEGVTYINREAIRSGTSIYEDKIIYYCGATYQHPELRYDGEDDPFITRSQILIYRLP